MACFLIVPMLVFLVSCSTDSDDDGWDAAKVCPETGTNSYGMPNRGTFTDERDGQVYKYTTIGKQVWMAENLRFDIPYPHSLCYGMEYCYPRKSYLTDTANVCQRDTSCIPKIRQNMDLSCTDLECVIEEHCKKFGRVYSLYEGRQLEGLLDRNLIDTICPKGWHVPSYDELKMLMNSVDEKPYRLIAPDSVCRGIGAETLGNDVCGFTACALIRDAVPILSRTSKSDLDAYGLSLTSDYYSIWVSNYMSSIRCLKD